MANNTAKIAELEAILQSGATSVTVDGVVTQIDLAEVRRQLRELRASDDTQKKRRPLATRIRLDNT